MRPMMKLFNQFEHVASATPFALREDGNISDGIAQGTCTDNRLSMACSNARDEKIATMSTYRSPRSSEAQHVKQQECDTNPSGCTVGWPIAGEFANQDGDNKMRQCHEEASPKQQWPSSKPIHRPKTSENSDELSDIEDA